VKTLLAVLLLLAAAPLRAQTNCDDALALAQKSYDVGDFAETIRLLDPCAHAALSRRAVIDVHRLLALAYLYNEEPEKARQEVSTILRLDSSFEATSPLRFATLVAQVRREEQVTQVASVSKTNESLREAPATVAVITADEIARRGYLDLEQLLHDLPAFDLTRTNGEIYSTVNVRGYRSNDSDRLLFLVDGIEQNELTTNTLYLSRQYPLSNIDRVEIVYGPASTMYGANAYTGVISIITKDAEAFLADKQRTTAVARATAGGYGGGGLDFTVAGKNGGGTIAWSLAGNVQKTKERDLSRFDEYDYTYKNFPYADAMRLSGSDADAFIAAGNCNGGSPYFRCDAAQHSVELTPAGVELVRGLDRGLVERDRLQLDDGSQAVSLYGKVRISNLTIGLEAWRSQDGTGNTNLPFLNAGDDKWTPQLTALYVKYQVPLERARFNFFTRYLQTGFDRERTYYHYLHNYSRGLLNLWSLVPPCKSDFDPNPVGCAPAQAWARKAMYGSLSSQLRSEANVSFQPSEKMSGVAGVEFAKSSTQSTFDVTSIAPVPVSTAFDGKPEQIEHTDVAVFGQGSYKVRPSLKLVLAGRLHYNQINNKPGYQGFGRLFTPRAAVIYSPRRALVLKAIYAEAFKDPTDYQKFGSIHLINDFPGGPLKPEKARNIEVSAGWEPDRRLSLESTLYRTHYTNVVSIGQVVGCDPDVLGCDQYQNRDEDIIRGAQLTARYRLPAAEIWGNYTRTEPFQTNPKDPFGNPLLDGAGNPIQRIRQADIATNRMSLGLDRDWAERIRASVRFHYVGARPTGAGTTQPDNALSRVDAYTTTDAAVTLRLFHDMSVQFIANNVFDKQYFDALPFGEFAPNSVLQSGRTFYLRLAYGGFRKGAER